MTVPAFTANDAPRLQAWLHEHLRAHPEGQGEFECIKALQAAAMPGFPDEPLTQPLSLFRMHFVLFHGLYRLRETLWREQQAHLEITPLSIRLLPYASGQAALTEPDPLRAYYLEVTHLHTTTEAEVQQKLAKFWTWFHAQDHRQAALRTLGLEDPVDAATLKQRYRELAMRHHPDRGGDNDRFRAIRQAFDQLNTG